MREPTPDSRCGPRVRACDAYTLSRYFRPLARRNLGAGGKDYCADYVHTPFLSTPEFYGPNSRLHSQRGIRQPLVKKGVPL